MSKLVWDQTNQRDYELGVEHAILFPFNASTGWYDKGVAWNGITGVTESPEGAEATDLWADNIKYASFRSAETFGYTIEAYQYPFEFLECDGKKPLTVTLSDNSKRTFNGIIFGQQNRKAFGFCYKTITGDGDSFNGKYDYILHFAYNSTVSPSEKTHDTINDSPDAATFSWEATTDPVTAGTVSIGGTSVQLLPAGTKRTSLVSLNVGAYVEKAASDAEKTTRENNIETLINFIEGTASSDPKMPTPWQIYDIISTGLTL